MSDRQEVQGALEALGSVWDEVESVLLVPEGEWIVRLADLDIRLEFDDQTRILSVDARLGPLGRTMAEDHRTTLLRYNLIRRDTGGIVMALDADGGVVQMLDVNDNRITTDLLLTLLDNFAAKARAWRVLLRGSAEGEPVAAPMLDIASFGIRI